MEEEMAEGLVWGTPYGIIMYFMGSGQLLIQPLERP